MLSGHDIFKDYGVDLRDLHANKEKIRDHIQDIEGKLIIKEYSMPSAFIRTIALTLRSLQYIIYPERHLKHYADLLRPVKVSVKSDNELENIHEACY